MFTQLNELQVKLAEQLLISVKKKEPYVEYGELAGRMQPAMNPRNVGVNVGEISKLCHELGLPFLSAKVISKGTHVAGAGYYPFYKMYNIDTHGLSQRELFKLECKKIRECQEWYKLADHLGIKLDLPRPEIEIRILPMSREEEFPGWSIEDVQNKYFLKGLIDEQGYYYYRKQGMETSAGSLVLFQFNNTIIAAAKLLEIKKYEIPVEEEYYGAYIFDKNSVTVFEPITFDEIHGIDTTVKPFSQTKQIIDYANFEKIQLLINSKKTPTIAEELPLSATTHYPEGAKKQITVNAYERNYKARQECVKHYGSICLICGFDFGLVYGADFQGKIHVHHIKPLAEIDAEYEIDPVGDLMPICPNCHFALHSKGGNSVYTVEELKEKIRTRNNQE